MGSIGMWEVAFLAVLALLVFGPDRLPGIARNVGKTVSTFKREATATLDELKAAADLDDVRGVADELRGTTRELRRSVDLSEATATPRANGATRAPERAGAVHLRRDGGPPPFDPTAT